MWLHLLLGLFAKFSMNFRNMTVLVYELLNELDKHVGYPTTFGSYLPIAVLKMGGRKRTPLHNQRIIKECLIFCYRHQTASYYTAKRSASEFLKERIRRCKLRQQIKSKNK
jgi:hypothetical protein